MGALGQVMIFLSLLCLQAVPGGYILAFAAHCFLVVVESTAAALEVLVVRRPEYDAASERSLLKEFRSRLGDEIAIELRYVDAIPREPNGKFRAVKSAVGRLR